MGFALVNVDAKNAEAFKSDLIFSEKMVKIDDFSRHTEMFKKGHILKGSLFWLVQANFFDKIRPDSASSKNFTSICISANCL